MNNLKKNIIASAYTAWVLVGYGAHISRADDQPAPAGEQGGEQPASPTSTAMTTPALTGPLVALSLIHI